MNDGELDALLRNAKPHQSTLDDNCWFWELQDAHNPVLRPACLPSVVFRLLKGIAVLENYREYATERGAMDALREAVRKYKEDRNRE